MDSPDSTTRQRLLDAALALFAQHGFAGTSMRALARAAGIRESSIYNHFSGKDELYHSVIELWGPAEFVERLRSDEYKCLSDKPQQFFKTCGKHLIERWMNPQEHLFLAMIAKEPIDGIGRRRFEQALFIDEIELLAEYCLLFSNTNGMISPDPLETARMFTGGLVQIRRKLFSSAASSPSRAAVEEAVARYIDNFIATTFYNNESR